MSARLVMPDLMRDMESFVFAISLFGLVHGYANCDVFPEGIPGTRVLPEGGAWVGRPKVPDFPEEGGDLVYEFL